MLGITTTVLRGAAALACMAAGCAPHAWLPDVGLHAASLRQTQVAEAGPTQRWSAALWADVSFQLDAPRTADRSPVIDDTSMKSAADGCIVPAVCDWERSNIATTLATLPQGDAP
jgi:hypothetical protein